MYSKLAHLLYDYCYNYYYYLLHMLLLYHFGIFSIYYFLFIIRPFAHHNHHFIYYTTLIILCYPLYIYFYTYIFIPFFKKKEQKSVVYILSLIGFFENHRLLVFVTQYPSLNSGLFTLFNGACW